MKKTSRRMSEAVAAPQADSGASMDSDASANGNRSAELEQLIRQHNDALVDHICRWVRSRSVARDIAQEAYAHILGLSNSNSVSYVRGYLYKTAETIASNWVRSRVTREPFIEQDSIRASQGTPVQICLAPEELETVRHAFKQLPPRTKMVIHLIKEDGLSYEEVAQQLGLRSMRFAAGRVDAGRVSR
jgi:RNA polymerase sigma factor (sigma-70 family)